MKALENRKDFEIGRVKVEDRDERGEGNWEAKYFISNDPGGHFAIRTDPGTNEGVLTVVKVQSADRREVLEGGVFILMSIKTLHLCIFICILTLTSFT